MSNQPVSEIIGLPKGGGALKAIGETFAPDAFTGTGNYSVPIEIPQGRNGFQPTLALTYSTGYGNSPFGLGWSLSSPGVTRKTSKGIPLYQDDRDIFILSGLEDLVPVELTEAQTRYRPRTDTTFSRIVHHHDRVQGTDYWEVRGRDGIVSFYGNRGSPSDLPDAAVLVDPSRPRHRFSWKLSETKDPFGNRIGYRYILDSGAVEQRRWNQVYLSDIRYVDYGGSSEDFFLVQVKVVYESRPDPFAEHRSGFEIRTTLRCTGIEVWTHAGTPRRVRTYHLKYLDELQPSKQPPNGVSLLAEVEVEGHDDESGRSQKLPRLSLGYGEFEPARRKFQAVRGIELPAASLADPDHDLVDLFGSGLKDIVEIGAQARYWRNLGGGRFDRPNPMRDTPAGVKLADAGVQLIDADGDGRADLVVTNERLAGYYPLSFSGEWDRRSFRRWEKAPTFSLKDPEIKLIDLDGDGVTDALRSSIRFECFFNDARKGWHETRQVERRGLESFPNVSFSDPRVRLADMTGDGLTDIVLLHEGRLDYWPSLGRGDFAPRMATAIPNALPRGYDPRRVLIGDVDGDGAADLVYVENRKVTLWINRGGEGWSTPIEILGTPVVSDRDSVRLVDLLGTGVAGILWSRDATSPSEDRLFFLDFVQGHKPYLLETIHNNMGAATRITYSTSTRYYVEDRPTPLRWQTTLPFPVQVVACVESIDEITGGKLATEYAYHHGYWDGAEREFRGFGRVDRRDSQLFDQYHMAAVGDGSEGVSVSSIEQRLFSAPTDSHMWFQLGPVGEEHGDWREVDYTSEYWAGDPQALIGFEEARTALEGLPRRSLRDALRALRGRLIRTELFAADGSDRADRPYTVTEHLHGVRLELAPTVSRGASAIFFPYEEIQRTTRWDRGVEPLTQLSATGAYDPYGLPRVRLSIAVPRGRRWDSSAPDPSGHFLASLSVTGYAQRDDADRYLVDRVAHETVFEILDDGRAATTNPRPSATGLWQIALESFRSSHNPVRRSVVAQTLNLYDGNDYEGLPLLQMGDHGALTRTEKLILTEDLLRQGFRSGSSSTSEPEEPAYIKPVTPPPWSSEYPIAFQDFTTRLTSLPPKGVAVAGGYIFHEGDSIRQRGFFAATVQRRHNARGLLTAERDAVGNEHALEYSDGYDLLPTRLVEPRSMVTRTIYDYRVLHPSLVVDVNLNETAYRYTPLGFLESIAVLGKPGRNEGDTSSTPSTWFAYDLDAFTRHREPTNTHTVRRTHHVNDPDDVGESIEMREFSDGFGRLIQTRTLAEDVLFGSAAFGDDVLPPERNLNCQVIGRPRSAGSPVNVVVTGWQTFDNKGRVVEKYEPFFSVGWAYEVPSLKQLGMKATVVYDPLGRVERTVNTDLGQQIVVYGIPSDLAVPDKYEPSPWESYAYDSNDNAGRTPDANASTRTDPSHWNTPTSLVFDALGRPTEQSRTNGTTPVDRYRVRLEYDIRGNLIRVWDELNRLAFQHLYDLSDRQLRIEHIDAGVSRFVFDAAGNLLEQRNANGSLVAYARDELSRLTHVWARDNMTDVVTLRELAIFGDDRESGLSKVDASDRNLLGRLNHQYDEAGLVSVDRYDLNGNIQDKHRRPIANATMLDCFSRGVTSTWQVTAFRPNWQPPETSDLPAHTAQILETTSYTISQRYDALNRLKWLEYPQCIDGSRQRLTAKYNRAGVVASVALDQSPVVEHVSYNARGQQTLIVYGTGDGGSSARIMTRRAYDGKTFRLIRLRTERAILTGSDEFAPIGEALQDVFFEHDLVGNVTSMHEDAPNSGIPGQTDHLDRGFSYDPLYRLVRASGRECFQRPPELWSTQPLCDDPGQTRRYTQTFIYDEASNLMKLEHAVGSGNGVPTREFDLLAQNNRLAAVRTASDPAAVHEYAYDAAGNIIRETQERHFEWDQQGRLRTFRVQQSGSEPLTHAQYLSDVGGRRVKKLLRNRGGGTVATTFIDDLFEHHRVTDGAFTYEFNTIHVIAGHRRLATVRIGDNPEDSSPSEKLQIDDHLGSNALMLTPDGLWRNREEYEPFGRTSFGSFAGKRYRFTGQESDSESGLFRHVARYYSPWLARWMSCDPQMLAHSRFGLESPSGWNLYSYGAANPVRYSDPMGTDVYAVFDDSGTGGHISIAVDVPGTNKVVHAGFMLRDWLLRKDHGVAAYGVVAKSLIVPQPGVLNIQERTRGDLYRLVGAKLGREQYTKGTSGEIVRVKTSAQQDARMVRELSQMFIATPKQPVAGASKGYYESSVGYSFAYNNCGDHVASVVSAITYGRVAIGSMSPSDAFSDIRHRADDIGAAIAAGSSDQAYLTAKAALDLKRFEQSQERLQQSLEAANKAMALYPKVQRPVE